MNKSDLTVDRFIYRANARAEQSRAEQSRAEQSRAEQSRAEQSRSYNCALFTSCDCRGLEKEYHIRDG